MRRYRSPREISSDIRIRMAKAKQESTVIVKKEDTAKKQPV